MPQSLAASTVNIGLVPLGYGGYSVVNGRTPPAAPHTVLISYLYLPPNLVVVTCIYMYVFTVHTCIYEHIYVIGRLSEYDSYEDLAA